MQVERPKRCVWMERTYYYVVANGSLKGNISQMEVVEDFESGPHKALSFLVEREKEMQRAEAAEGAALVTVEEGCKEEAQKHKAEQKER